MSDMEKATLAGGCFWCTEAIFRRLKGVTSVEPGYSGGKTENPTYEQVSSGNTGHAEVIQIKFDPSLISFEKILDVFFATHDPTTLNRQGNDIGTQYRSAIFYHSEEQKKKALNAKEGLQKKWDSESLERSIVTEIVPFKNFYKAENYHKDYFEKNKNAPYCQLIIDPKIKKLLKNFKDIISS